jgi:MoxR-like ATPase
MTPEPPDNRLERTLFEVKKMIVGQEHLLEMMLVALLARGHLLIEGVPGLAKTLAVKTLAQAIGGTFKRIQFTPDLVPADLVGTRVYNQHTGEFTTQLGPVFANLVLADEINRAPAKVQSALLEVMQEHQVTIGNETYQVPEPFFVMATQNPIESEGTYNLPEAQVDRFMFKVVIDYPSRLEEAAIVARVTGERLPEVNQVLTPEDLLEYQRVADRVYVDPKLVDYAVTLVAATRRPAEFGIPELGRYVAYGSSPRGSIYLIAGAKALATLRGRDYVLPEDMTYLVMDTLRHRLILTYEALAQGITPEQILSRIMEVVRPPRIELIERRTPEPVGEG